MSPQWKGYHREARGPALLEWRYKGRATVTPKPLSLSLSLPLSLSLLLSHPSAASLVACGEMF